MKEESYTFGEVVFGLREEYVKNQKLLNELKKYVKVEGIKDNEWYIYGNIDWRYQEKYIALNIDIVKEQSKLVKMIRYILDEYTVIDWGYNNPSYKTEKKDNVYSFKKDNTVISDKKYNIEITDKDAFEEITNNVLQSKIINHFYMELNPFQNITICPYEIDMCGNFRAINSNAFPIIKYNQYTDSIFARIDYRTPKFLVSEFFDTKIPKCFTPDEYREIIDKSIEKHKNLNVAEVHLDGRNTELNIIETNDGIKLTKKKKLKFYE